MRLSFSRPLPQTAHSVAAVRPHLRRSGRGELGGHGVLHRHPVHDAAVRGHLDSVLQLEDEQEPGLYDVPAVFCVCGRVAGLRVRFPRVPGVVCENERAKEREREKPQENEAMQSKACNRFGVFCVR